MRKFFCILILASILCALIKCASSSPQTVPISNSDIQTGSVQIVINTLTNITWSTTVNFVKSKSSLLYSIAVVIQALDLRCQNISSNFIFNLFTKASQLNISSFSLAIESSDIGNLFQLTVRYICVTNTFSVLNIVNKQFNNLNYDNNNNCGQLGGGSVDLDNSKYPKRLFLLSGFHFRYNNMNMHIGWKYDSVNDYPSSKIKICADNSPLSIIKMTYQLLYYLENQVQQQKYTFKIIDLKLKRNSSSFISASSIETNWIAGLAQFHIDDSANLKFQFSQTNQPKFSLSTSIYFNKMDYLQIKGIIFLDNFKCISPYIYSYSSLCYDNCPVGYYNIPTLTCSPCAYDCYECTNSSDCTTCNPTNFRKINTTTKRCDPIIGYYDNGNKNAAQCDNTTCLGCQTTNTNCISCHFGKYLNLNTCSTCMSHCQKCLDINSCDQCEKLYTFNPGLNKCQIICTFRYCTSCIIQTGTPNWPQCSICQYGYQIISKECKPKCGDRIIVAGEECDDGNNNNNDGCSASCIEQTYFKCNQILSTNNSSYKESQCSPTFYLIKDVILKDQNANKMSIVYHLDPRNPNLYSLYQWNNIAVISSLQQNTYTLNYDPNSNLLTLNIAYAQDLNNKDITITFNNPQLSNIQLTTTLLADNNLSLSYYSESVYALAAGLKYISLIISICSILIFFAGYFGAKIVALEYITVVQITYLILFTIDDSSPTFQALSYLKFACGVISFGSYTQVGNINRKYALGQYSLNFINNYNISILVILLPLIIAIILKRCSQKKVQYKQKLIFAFQRSLGQYSFYGFMFSNYILYFNVASTIKLWSYNSAAISAINIIIGILSLLLSIIYFILFYKKPKFFGQFKYKFLLFTHWQRYYSFKLIEKFITTLLIVFLMDISLSSLGPIIILTIDLILVIKYRPYIGIKEWIRPTVNKISTIIIMLLFLATKFTNSQNFINIYSPIIILFILSLCLGYNIFFIIRDLKESYIRYENLQKAGVEQTFEQKQRLQFKELQMKIIPNEHHFTKTLHQNYERINHGQLKLNWENYHIVNHSQRNDALETIKQKISKKKYNPQNKQTQMDQYELN